jgi:CheY-like chemotaxis protein
MSIKPNLRILVADDNRMVLATVCHMLKALACDVQEAAHGIDNFILTQRHGDTGRF